MKKGLIFLLLSWLFLQSAIVAIVLELHRSVVMESMNHRGDDGARVVHLKFSDRDYQKAATNDHEILLDGKRYDIRTKKVHGNSIELDVILDEEENAFMSLIEKSSGNDSGEPLSIHLLKSLCLLGDTPVNTSIGFFLPCNDFYFKFFSNELSSFKPGTTVPPPQLG